MAKLRKFVAYRRLERPYTRVSKYRKKAFVKVRPNSLIVKYCMGKPKDYKYQIDLVSKKDIQIRHNSIESARQTCNRCLERSGNHYYYIIKIFPHHILRENPLAAGAGADRMSTGMSHSFGKVVGIAARVMENQTIFTIKSDSIETAKNALRKAASKLPGSTKIIIKRYDFGKNKKKTL